MAAFGLRDELHVASFLTFMTEFLSSDSQGFAHPSVERRDSSHFKMLSFEMRGKTDVEMANYQTIHLVVQRSKQGK